MVKFSLKTKAEKIQEVQGKQGGKLRKKYA